jgi:hypothetical protein
VEQDIQNQDQLIQEETKEDLEFRSYAVLTFWIIPVMIAYLVSLNLFFPLLLIGLLLELKRYRFVRFIRYIIYILVVVTFGIKLKKQRPEMLRIWWLMSFGGLIAGGISVLIVYTLSFLLPVIIIIYRRKIFLKYIFVLASLPRTSYVNLRSTSERDYEKKIYESLSEEEKDYLIFKKPKRLTHIVTALIIFLTPIMLSILLVPLISVAAGSRPLIQEIYQKPLLLAGIGLLAILPYLLLTNPIIKNTKYIRLINTKLTTFIIKVLAGTGLNTVPMFKGDYYLEKKSEILDMSSSTGFFAIFKSGRLLTIILTPLAIISLIFDWTILNLDNKQLASLELSPNEFLSTFGNELLDNYLIYILIFLIVPILLSTLLPLVFALYDAEIKRATWDTKAYLSGREINNVEDVGKTINNLFKIVVGVGAIMSLSSNISLVLGRSNPLVAWLITGIVLIIGAVLILPGTLFLVYTNIASGEHALGVNYIRYHISNAETVSVGTISKDYRLDDNLSRPPAEIAKAIGLAPLETIVIPTEGSVE